MRRFAGRVIDDFAFVTPTGPPIHNADFYEFGVDAADERPRQTRCRAIPFHRLRDKLRDTDVAWLVAGDVHLPSRKVWRVVASPADRTLN